MFGENIPLVGLCRLCVREKQKVIPFPIIVLQGAFKGIIGAERHGNGTS